ncbi:MAG: hypothetical protein JRH13_11370 [Deltaproteobacteria bacterium]|nr:hypothetical protein [Deltaproteobacteria bacterium]MBW2015248.1 hypothetical protein [Deltaproteobacteria bacterium]MBW2129951.1 hypothetical protein [Deltaproteobacteria bacterium]MBW2302351.1 hypothetical protein [Deltaproteobacteria bacterium]
MKKLFALLVLSMFLFGCGAAARESEFWQHDTLYKNWDHTKFSLWGYKHPTKETYKKSLEQGWWGIEIPYIPAE